MEANAHEMLLALVTALSAGILVMVVAHRIHVSAIVLLLAAGVGLGPEGLGVFDPEVLGDVLPVIVSLAVGLILFEGGLTLDLRGYRSASRVIKRLLSIGVLTTWISTALAIWLVMGYPIPFALLAASLVIVTGPTVIAPLLKRIRVLPKVHSILHWEGVLINPVGVFVALLCFEWIEISAGSGAEGAVRQFLSGGGAVGVFAYRIVAGLGIGVAGGFAIERLIKWRLPPRDMVNAFSMGCAVLIFGLADALVSEAGILAVTASGFVLGVRRPAPLKELRAFKAQITELMVGMLFILLTARLELHRFEELKVAGLLTLAVVLFAVRPLNVILSSWGLGLSWREKTFLSWIAPRGIVAASMASLFAIRLEHLEFPDAKFIETFTYSVIVATVVLQGFTAGPLASLLKLKRPPRKGWLVVGSNTLGRAVARFLQVHGRADVVVVDSHPGRVAAAAAEGLPAICADARDVEAMEAAHDVFLKVGHLLALTDNPDLNLVLCRRWSESFGHQDVYRWAPDGFDPSAGARGGQAVWASLPKPSQVSAEMRRETASVFRVLGFTDPREDRPPGTVAPLLALEGEAVLLEPTSPGNRDEPRLTLFVHRKT